MTEALPEAAVLGLPQVYEQGKGLPFHFDKDESLFKEQQAMVHPMLSSVLYLTGASAAPKRLGKAWGLPLGCILPTFWMVSAYALTESGFTTLKMLSSGRPNRHCGSAV